MPRKKKKGWSLQKNHLRTWIFSIGLLLVVLFMLLNPEVLTVWRALILLIFGALVGFLDVPRKEQNSFLLAAIGIMLTTAVPFQNIQYLQLGLYLKAFLMNIALFLVPGVVIVALKILYRLLQETRH